MILTGATAALFFDTLRIGKCRQISLEVDREALPTTKQGDIDRTFISGLRDTKGSASLFYDPSDPAVDALMTKVFTDSASLSSLDLVFDTVTDEKFTVQVVLTSAALTTGYGSAQVCEIQFQVSGKPLSGYIEVPVVPPPPSPGSKWVSYSTENEVAVNTHTVLLDDLGNTYAFIASQQHSELTKLSPIGAVIWVRRFTSFAVQQEWSTFGFSGVKVNQTVHLVNSNLLVCCITDKLGRTHFIGVDGSGNILYNKAYQLAAATSTQNIRLLSYDKTKLVTANATGSGSANSMAINVIDTSNGTLIKRFTFSSISGANPRLLRNAIQKQNGNWVFYLDYNAVPYPAYYIETNSGLSSATRCIQFLDLGQSDTFVARPDTSGYILAGSSYLHYLNDSFQVIESRRFFGEPRSILYDANGDYYIWSNYTSWYQDLGIPGWPSIITLIKYNWNTDYVYYATMTNTTGSITGLNKTVQRMVFAQQAVDIGGGGGPPSAYRMISSFDLVQPSATSGSPISTTNPPNFTFRSRSVLTPTTRPVIETKIHTRNEINVSLVELSLVSEAPVTFVVEAVTRNFTVVSSS